MKMQKNDWIAIIITIAFFQILCLWCIDVSTSTLLFQEKTESFNNIESTVYLTNGIIQQHPLLTYHLALFILVVTSFLSTLIVVHLLRDQSTKSFSSKLKKTRF